MKCKKKKDVIFHWLDLEKLSMKNEAVCKYKNNGNFYTASGNKNHNGLITNYRIKLTMHRPYIPTILFLRWYSRKNPVHVIQIL